MKSIGTAPHRYDDGSVHKIRVEVAPKNSKGYPGIIRDPEAGDPWNFVGVAGARQARVLANWLTLLADQLEKRGQL